MKPPSSETNQAAGPAPDSSEISSSVPADPKPATSSRNSRYTRLATLLAVVWVAVIAAVWFGLHPLFDIEFPLYPPEITGRIAGTLGNFLLDIGLLALTTLASFLVGYW